MAGRSQGAEEEQVMRSIVRESKPPRKIHHIQFAMMDADDMTKLSTIQIISNGLYSPGQIQTPYGVLDQRLGTSQKNGVCATCNEKIESCVGHFGYIRLELPVYHIGFFKATMSLLQCVCKSCARLLLPDDQILAGLQKRRRKPPPDTLMKKAMTRAVLERCKRCRCCPHCGAFNGAVKKARPLKLYHECYTKRTAAAQEAFHKSCGSAIGFNDQLAQHINKAQEDINPAKARAAPARAAHRVAGAGAV